MKVRVVTADGIIVRDNKILLVKRLNEPFAGYWALPGGFLEFDETLEQCIFKEVKEETNLKVKRVDFFGVYSNPKRDPDQKVTVVYIVETQGDPKAGDDAGEAQFFELDRLPKDLAFDHKKIIEEYIKFRKG